MGGSAQYSSPFGPMPSPTPEHQKRITKQKWFEIVLVIALIVAGAGFLGWREYRTRHHTDPALSLKSSTQSITSAGLIPSGTTTLRGRRFVTFSETLDSFDCHVDLVGEADAAPLDIAIIWLTPSSAAAPSVPALQNAVNRVQVLAQRLVQTSADALEKATKTMTFVGDAKRPHDKGVSGSSNGWKVTYVTYHAFDDTSEPMLCLVLHRLSAASDPALADLNRDLYEALNRGDDLKTALGAGSRG